MIYEVLDFHFSKSEANGRISGHPTAALNKARDLCRAVFSEDVAWRFTNISYDPPSEDDFASDGTILFMAKAV